MTAGSCLPACREIPDTWEQLGYKAALAALETRHSIMDPTDSVLLPLETTSMEDLVALAQAKGIQIEVTIDTNIACCTLHPWCMFSSHETVVDDVFFR